MSVNIEAVNPRNIPKLPMEQAAALLIKKGITKSSEFYKVYKDAVPRVIPNDPKNYYEQFDGWRSFIAGGQAFLEQGKQPEEELPSFQALKARVNEKAISSRVAYVEAVKSGELGELAPMRPDNVYLDEFSTWVAFLAKPGVDRFLSFEDAQEKMKELGIKTSSQWMEYCAEGKRPDNLPYQPSVYYADQWKGWKHFLR